MENNIISAEFSHFRHIKTRKVVVLECEIAEELFQDAISKLGMPIGGESKPVAIALLDNTLYHKTPVVGKSDIPQTEGERLRTRAVILCKDDLFNKYITEKTGLITSAPEQRSRSYIMNACMIISRSELAINVDAQQRFKAMLTKYESWKLENQYKDNLGRV